MHLICFVQPEDVEKAQAILDTVKRGATYGAKAVGEYGTAWGKVPRIFRIPVDVLEDAGIRNFALPNVGGLQLMQGY